MCKYFTTTDYYDLYTAALTTAAAAIEVTLRSVDQLDDIEERKLVLQPNSTVPIGRSSKNSNKKLTAAVDNAYIDSPVISRDHATLSLRPAMGTPTIYITDNGSMHGTLVNGAVLPRRVDHKLGNGDTLQFGVDVIRDQGKPCCTHSYPAQHSPLADSQADARVETFIAKQYHFSSRPAAVDSDRLYSRGISVPESSDDEVDHDVTLLRSSPHPPKYGSQTNPVNIDDFENARAVVVELSADEDDDHPPEVASSKPTVDEKSSIKEQSSPVLFPSAVVNTEQDPESENDSLLDAGEDDADSINSDLAVFDAYGDNESDGEDSMGQSDVPMDSESEDSGSDNEDLDTTRREKLAAMLDHEQNKSSVTNAPSSPPPALPPRSTLAPGPTTLPRPSGLFESFPSVDMGSVSWGPMSQPPLPPRPSAPKPFAYNAGMSSNPIAEVNIHNPWFDDASVNMFGMHMNEYPLPSFSRAGPAYTPQFTRPYASVDNVSQPTFSANNPTPTPKTEVVPEYQQPAPSTATPTVSTPPTRASDEASSVTPQQSSRTKVSIAEIVEEAPEQPPTPTSMAATPNLKRKAEFMSAEEDEDSEEMSLREIRSQQAPSADIGGLTVAERPKKKARSSRSGLFHYAAGAVIGAAAMVGGLLYVPEAWLQPGL